MMKAHGFLLCFSMLLLFTATPGLAYSSEFEITWTGGYGPGHALLTATNDGGGRFIVTWITGTQNGANIPGPIGAGIYGNSDNVIFPFSSPALDNMGIPFTGQGKPRATIYSSTTFPGLVRPYTASTSSALPL